MKEEMVTTYAFDVPVVAEQNFLHHYTVYDKTILIQFL